MSFVSQLLYGLDQGLHIFFLNEPPDVTYQSESLRRCSLAERLNRGP